MAVPRFRRAAGAVCAVGLSAVLGLAAAGPAQARDSDYLLLSTDGETFTPSIDHALFTGLETLVPGQSIPGRLWVRNAGPETAYLSMGGLVGSGDEELAGYLRLEARPQGQAGSSVPLGHPGSCADVAQGWELASGRTVEVDLGLGLVAAAPNETMNRTMSFSILLLLDSAGQPRSACGSSMVPEPNPGPAPETGTGDGTENDGVTAPGGGRPDGGGADEDRSPDATAVVGLGPAQPVASPALGLSPDTPGSVPAAAGIWPKQVEAPVNLSPAAFWQSTVEPVIRTVPGTLLLIMAVAFCAAAIYRLRMSRGHGQESAG